jgi:tungstate transport system permease protein
MQYLADAVVEALRMIAAADPHVVAATWASLRFSVISTILASLIGIPIGAFLALGEFPMRRLVVAVLDTLLALPTVVVGLFVYALLCRQGPAGELGLLFTPYAIVIGQTVLIVPVVAALSRSAVAAVPRVYASTALTLGAGRASLWWVVLREARPGVLAACVTAFGRVIGEVGVSMMLGGNIAGYTRTITTVIALETRKGEFALALALGIILLVLAFTVNLVVRLLGGRES